MSMTISIKNGKANTVCRVTRIFRDQHKKTCVIKIKDHLMFKWYAWTQIGDNNLVLKTATIK